MKDNQNRALRRHLSEKSCAKQESIRKAHQSVAHATTVDSTHRFHKRKAMNCGNPRCFMCGNPRGLMGNSKDARTIQEQRLLQTNLQETLQAEAVES